jgi:hypothetical protein
MRSTSASLGARFECERSGTGGDSNVGPVFLFVSSSITGDNSLKSRMGERRYVMYDEKDVSQVITGRA